MASTSFVDKTTIINTTWLNDVNTLVWGVFGGATTAALARTALGLGSIATQASSAVAITGGTISGTTVSGYATTGLATASGLTQSTAKLLGRTTASTGAIEEISVGTGMLLSAGVLSSPICKSKIITFSRSGATGAGDVAYTGVGFQPNLVIILSGQTPAAAVGAWGFSDSSLGQATLSYDSSAGGFDFLQNKILELGQAANQTLGLLKSYDADGFTITYSKTGAPGGTYQISALCILLPT